MSNCNSMTTKLFVSILFVLCVVGNGADALRADSSNTQLTEEGLRKLATWSGESMNVEVDLTGGHPIYSGTLKLKQGAPSSDGPVLLLNLGNVSFKFLNVEIIGSNRELPNYTFEQNIPQPDDGQGLLALIHFEKPVPQSTEIEVTYKYEYIAEQGQVLHRPDLEYASWVTGWYPSPIADEEGLVSSKSLTMPGQVSFILKKHWSALSNGKLIEDKVIGENKRQTWSTDEGLAWSYIAAPFTVTTVAVGDVDVSMYMLNKDPKVVEDKAVLISKLITLLEEKFGDYPYKTFGLAEIPDNTTDYFGASSEQGFIVAESKNFINDYGLTLFSHEVGHAWWGNKFSCTGPGSSLCTEAMAQIGTVLGTELIHGKQAMRNVMEVSEKDYTPYQSARGFFAMWRAGEAVPLNKVDGWLVHRMMDSKGMWFWQMLREKIGDEKFFNILHSLANGELKKPTLVDLEAYFSKKTNSDLSIFFDQWLNRTGVPIIDMKWHGINPVGKNKWRDDVIHERMLFSLDEGQKQVSITLNQEQKELYALNPEIEIGFYRKPPIRKTLAFADQQKTYIFDVDGMIKYVVLDPDHKILMWRPAYGPKPDLTK